MEFAIKSDELHGNSRAYISDEFSESTPDMLCVLDRAHGLQPLALRVALVSCREENVTDQKALVILSLAKDLRVACREETLLLKRRLSS